MVLRNISRADLHRSGCVCFDSSMVIACQRICPLPSTHSAICKHCTNRPIIFIPMIPSQPLTTTFPTSIPAVGDAHKNTGWKESRTSCTVVTVIKNIVFLNIRLIWSVWSKWRKWSAWELDGCAFPN